MAGLFPSAPCDRRDLAHHQSETNLGGRAKMPSLSEMTRPWVCLGGLQWLEWVLAGTAVDAAMDNG